MYKLPKTVRLALSSFLVFCGFSGPLHAQSDNAVPAVVFSGFGTLGVVHNDGKGSVFTRDLMEPNGATNRGLSWEVDTRIGVQADFKPTDNLAVVAQVISRYRIDNNFKPELTWGFLRYTPNNNVELRAGRVGFDVFLGSDSRDVGYSYLWVRPPVDYYGQLFNSYIDGGDVAFHSPLGSGVGQFKLFSGLVRQQFAVGLAQKEWAGNITGNASLLGDLAQTRITGGVVDYQDIHWTLRIARADLKMRATFIGNMSLLVTMLANEASQSPPALASALNAVAAGFEPTGKNLGFTSIGLTYENGPLQTQAALSRLTSNLLSLPDADSGYVSVGYRHGKFMPYAVISSIRSEGSNIPNELTHLGASSSIVGWTQLVQSKGVRTQNTISLGLRYDFAKDVALKLQVDAIHNKSCSPVSLPVRPASPGCAPPALWPGVPVTWDGRAIVSSAVLDFLF